MPLYKRVPAILFAFLFFIFAILLVSSAIKSFGYDYANLTTGTVSNPFVALLMGLLATAILQSSSTTTTIVVAAVASGSLSLQQAIPVILGANIGTTLTSSIVAMGYITKSAEFKKAIMAGTMHDFFNIIMVIILFPFEMKYGVLSKTSSFLAQLLRVNNQTDQYPTYQISSFFEVANSWIIAQLGSVISLLLGILLLFICIKLVSNLLYNQLIGKTRKAFETTVFSTTARSFSSGLLLTSAAQSSSLTSCLIVPLVAAGKVKIRRAFEFILGANLGTTITALLAAVFQSEAAISIALVHLIFNLIGVTLFLFIPFLKNMPILLANKLSDLTLKLRIAGFMYIVIAFFILPFLLIYSSSSVNPKDSTEQVLTEP